MTNGRGSRVAGRVLYVEGGKMRDFQPTPATYIRDPRPLSLYQLACEEDNKNISPLLAQLFQVSIYVHLCNQLQQATGDRRKANALM